MHINNELGHIHDIASIAKIRQKHGVLLHVDGAQTIGKIRPDLTALGVDLYTMSAHKAYGPKGIGALYQTQS